MTDSEQNHDLRKAIRRLEGIISSAMDAIISVNSEQQILVFNHAAELLFKVPADEAIGQHLNRFIPERFRAAHTTQMRMFGALNATHRRMGRPGQIFGLRADGSEFPAEASISHAEADGKRIYTVIIRDVTERMALELAVQEGQKNLERLVQERTARLRDTIHELEQISYSIIHDMRGPLRAIQSFAGILQTEAGTSLSQDHQGYLSAMQKAAARMDALIRDVLTYNSVVRKEVTMAPLDPVALLRSVVLTYPALQTPGASLNIEPGIPKVMANEALLTQCFSNLLGNAFKFAKPGEVPQIRVHGNQEGQWIRISITDSGIGIPAELQEKIFGIFERLSSQTDGTGIGLAIVKKAMERMGGRITVESTVGAGSTFHLDLPPG